MAWRFQGRADTTLARHLSRMGPRMGEVESRGARPSDGPPFPVEPAEPSVRRPVPLTPAALPPGEGFAPASGAGGFSWWRLGAGLSAAARGAARLLRRTCGAAGGDERDRLVERHGVGAQRPRERRVDLAVGDVGAEAAGLDHDRLAGAGLLAERAAGVALAAAAEGGAAFFRDDEVDRPVGADRQHVVVLLEVGVGLGVLDVRAVAADADEDRRA